MSESTINNDKYVANIYVNGEPYKVRDEEAQVSVKQLEAICKLIQFDVATSQNILNKNFDEEKNYTGTIQWNDSKIIGSKIPKIEVVDSTTANSGQFKTLEISLL